MSFGDPGKSLGTVAAVVALDFEPRDPRAEGVAVCRLLGEDEALGRGVACERVRVQGARRVAVRPTFLDDLDAGRKLTRAGDVARAQAGDEPLVEIEHRRRKVPRVQERLRTHTGSPASC
jgi:hypothetical protein